MTVLINAQKDAVPNLSPHDQMKQASVRRAVLTVLAAVVLLVIATSPFWTAILIKWQAKRIVEDTMVGLTTSGRANLNIAEGFVETWVAINATEQGQRQAAVDQIAKLSAVTDQQLASYRSTIVDPVDRRNLDNLVQSRATFRATRQRVIDLLNEGKRDEAVSLFQKQGLPEFQTYMGALNPILQYNVDEAKERGTQILHLCNVIMVVQGLLVIFFFIYAFFVPLTLVLEKLWRRESHPEI